MKMGGFWPPFFLFFCVFYISTLTFNNIIILHIADSFYIFALTNKTLITYKTNNIMIKFKIYVRFKGCKSLQLVDEDYSLESAYNILDSYIADCYLEEYQIVKIEETIVRKKLCAK